MYPYYGNVLESATPELIAFEKDLDDLGMISTLEEWFIGCGRDGGYPIPLYTSHP